MVAAHIAGVPVEETLLSLGGPAVIYLAAVSLFAAVRRTRARVTSFSRRHIGAGGR
jgi:hypothetical protein